MVARPPPWVQESHFDVLALEHLEHLQNSADYKDNKADKLETRECQLQYKWQRQTFPACNNVHEIRLQEAHFLAHGGWRDAWKVTPHTTWDQPVALKTSSTFVKGRKLSPFVMERQRKDAIILERLSGHPFVLDIYGFCATTYVLELASGGNIKGEFKDPHHPSKTTWLQRLHIGVQAAMGLASLHNFDHEGRASVLHGDLDVAQFLAVGAGHGDNATEYYYKLNDFNLAQFLLVDRQNTTRICPSYHQHFDWKHRSPEAYSQDGVGQTDRVRCNFHVSEIHCTWFMALDFLSHIYFADLV